MAASIRALRVISSQLLSTSVIAPRSGTAPGGTNMARLAGKSGPALPSGGRIQARSRSVRKALSVNAERSFPAASARSAGSRGSTTYG